MTGIPERWENYSPIGERIQGTRFIAFKVPLHERLSETCKDYLRLDIKTLLKRVPNLGAIVDLTNTYRYYNPEVFKSTGIEYFKLMIPGHATPPSYLVKKFKIFVRNFLQNNKRNDKLIGVHCTHGVNRTGYLICSYMISEMSIKPSAAILAFRCARGYPIERKNYIEALHSLVSKTRRDRTGSLNGREKTTRKQLMTFSNNLDRKKENHRGQQYSRDEKESRHRTQYAPDNRSNNRNSYLSGSSIRSGSRRDEKPIRSFIKTPSFNVNLNPDWVKKKNERNGHSSIKRKVISREEYEHIHPPPPKRRFENDNQNSWKSKRNCDFNLNQSDSSRSRNRGFTNDREEKYKNDSSQSWRNQNNSNTFNPFRARNNEFVEKSNKREEHFSREKYNQSSSWRTNHFGSNQNQNSQKTWNKNNFERPRPRTNKSEISSDRKHRWNSSRNGRT